MGKKSKKQEGLELIHLNISGPIHPTSMRCYNYFITFIDDYFTFGWVVTQWKTESLDAFKTFKATIELDYVKKIKCVNFESGGKYSKRYKEIRRILGHFTS